MRLDASAIEQDRLRADRSHHPHVVADEQDRRARRLHLPDAPDALVLKDRVADGQRLVDEQDIRIDVNGGRERQPHEHAARVRLHRPVDELADPGERLDGGQPRRRSPRATSP